MSAYVITNIDVDDETVFLVRAGSESRRQLFKCEAAQAVTSRTLSEARLFGSRSAASEYIDYFNLRAQGWTVDSAMRFKWTGNAEIERPS